MQNIYEKIDTMFSGQNDDRPQWACEILDELYPIKNNSKLKTQNSSLKSYKELITFVTDRPGHDRRYAIDASKIENELGWMAEENFESGIVKTVEWYLEKRFNLE